MNQDDAERFTILLSKTAAAYRVEIGEETYLVYFEDLCDLDINRITEALTEHRKASRFFPSVAEIRSLASRQVTYDRLGMLGPKRIPAHRRLEAPRDDIPRHMWRTIHETLERIGREVRSYGRRRHGDGSS